MWDQAAEQLREEGAAVLQGVFPVDRLKDFQTAADICFGAVTRSQAASGRYRFTPFSNSVVVEALREFGAVDPMAPVGARGLGDFLDAAMGEPVECRLAESWVRKRFAPSNAPRLYQPNTWHQDGGLGVAYGSAAGEVGPMNRLITCWLPLRECDSSCPGLELVRERLGALLHYRELDDARLRQRFAAELFWAPRMELGDALVFHPDTLHRTWVRPDMREDRISVEYRFFPAGRLGMKGTCARGVRNLG